MTPFSIQFLTNVVDNMADFWPRFLVFFSFLLVSIKTIKTFIWLLALETRQVHLSLTLVPLFLSCLYFKREM